ncbi:PIR Superfamily Protein [Plasmodium ovale curtisi]|uniref:PIR Superfamily Protein n=1 Tax=Plasmodium ovale curtisi TaxID=864141 RepID=A0A1A8WAI4_PLAOA|nr:PIR Superfamily Protein [Plasmodium ovale curtisi]
MGKINEDNLPSNRYKKYILTNSEIDGLINTCITLNRESECIAELTALNTKLYTRYHSVRTQCNSSRADPRCCRDMNYCIDNIISIIKSSKFDDSDKKDYIRVVEEYWKGIFNKRYSYECKREEDTHSTYKRCILSQLYDYNDDKNYLETIFQENRSAFQEYDEYLIKKWGRIIKHDKSINEYINISINGHTIKENLKCDNLPLTSDILKNIIINNGDKINLTFSNAARTPPLDGPFDTKSEVSRISHSTGSEVPVMQKESVDKTSTPFTRIIVTAVSVLLGTFFLLFMLYKFSPLGSLVNNRIKKKGKMKETINYEKTQLSEKQEDNPYYIGYDSSNH